MRAPVVGGTEMVTGEHMMPVAVMVALLSVGWEVASRGRRG